MVPAHELALPVNFSVSELISGFLFMLSLTVTLRCHFHTETSLQSSLSGNICLFHLSYTVPAVCTALQGRESCKCFCGCNLFYPSVLRVADTVFQVKECQCLPERALCYPCQHKVIAKVISACPMLLLLLKYALFITWQTNLWSCSGLPGPFVLWWGLIYPLNCLHASPVQLTDDKLSEGTHWRLL